MPASTSRPELSPRSVNDLLEHGSDVPPPPASYNEYIERKLRDSIRDAYARGFHRGCQHQGFVLFVGMLLGCLLGAYIAIASQ